MVKISRKPSRGKIYGYGKIERVHGEKYKFLEGHSVYFYLNGERDYIPSQVLRMESGIRILKPHPSETFFSYLVQKNIFLYAYRGEVREVLKEATPFHRFFGMIRHELYGRIASYVQKHGKQPSDGILYGLLLSEKKELSRQQKDNFHNSGAAHLLAVSGLHIGIIGFALDFLLHCLFLGKIWRRFPIILILLFYVAAIGFPPSALRAWLMILCHWSAQFFHRRPSSVASFLNAAILSLLCDPMLLFDIGFQLSYAVVALLLLLASPLRDGLLWVFKYLGSKNPRKIYFFRKTADLVSLSIAATLASAPLTFEYFNMFSLLGILLNPVLIQMALPTVVCGFLFLFMGLFSLENWLSDVLFLGTRWGANCIDRLLFWSEHHIPWYVEFLSKPNGSGMLCFLLILLSALWIHVVYVQLRRKTLRECRPH
jgi:competence protein ComEC